MGWKHIASGTFACSPELLEGEARIVVGIEAIVKLMRDPDPEQKIIFTDVAGGSAVSTIIQKAKAIVSTIGGPNSHIVVVARDYGKPCIVGAAGILLDELPDGTWVRLDPDGGVSQAVPSNGAPDKLAEADYAILRKIAFAGVVASVDDILGVPREHLAENLARLVSDGLVTADDIVMLTESGTQTVEDRYTQERLGFADMEDAVISDFRPLDRELKRIARAWQDSEAADDWDSKLNEVAALSALSTGASAFVRKYGDRLPRLEEYDRRLALALRKVESGETEYVVAVRVDSFHTIWFQFHEDLLRLLQRQRDAE